MPANPLKSLYEMRRRRTRGSAPAGGRPLPAILRRAGMVGAGAIVDPACSPPAATTTTTRRAVGRGLDPRDQPPGWEGYQADAWSKEFTKSPGSGQRHQQGSPAEMFAKVKASPASSTSTLTTRRGGSTSMCSRET